jgi:imidazolonepropionase
LSQFTLLYGARQVLTLRGSNGARRGAALHDLGIIENGSVLIQNGLIYAVGPTRRIENLKQSKGAMTLDVSGSIIMPGLVDPDFHLTYGNTHNGSASGSSRARRSGQLYDDGVTLMRSCLQHGTLAAVLKASAGRDDFRSDISLLRLIDKIGNSTVDMVRTWHLDRSPQTDGEFDDFQTTLATLSRRRLVDSLSLCSKTAIASDNAAWLVSLLQAQLPINLKWVNNEVGILAAMVEGLRPRSIACSSSITPEEIRILAESPAIAVFAPGTEVNRLMGDAMRGFIDASGAIALSSGYHPVSAPGFSMQMAISLAIVRAHLTPEEAISAATVNAAWAAGKGHVSGTLEQGKRADILVMTVSDYRDIARQFGINNVGTVLRQGSIVFNRTRRKIMTDEHRTVGVRS